MEVEILVGKFPDGNWNRNSGGNPIVKTDCRKKNSLILFLLSQYVYAHPNDNSKYDFC